MEILDVSKKIVEIVNGKMAAVLEEAKSLDFSNNISLLNLILLSGTENYDKEYKLVKSNLTTYSNFMKSSNLISRKQRYAYKIYNISPKLYYYLLRFYSSIFAKDLVHRTIS